MMIAITQQLDCRQSAQNDLALFSFPLKFKVTTPYKGFQNFTRRKKHPTDKL